MEDYPLSKKASDVIKSKTGKLLDDINIESVMKELINSEDIKISKEVLALQGKIAENNGRPQMKDNFLRASELIDVPDELILKIYNMLRPNRSTKKELVAMALKLKNEYNAESCSHFILEAVRIYEKRGILIPEGVKKI
jgi:propanediol dehydratase small subunit